VSTNNKGCTNAGPASLRQARFAANILVLLAASAWTADFELPRPEAAAASLQFGFLHEHRISLTENKQCKTGILRTSKDAACC
jgi:hypothetical protein